MERYLLGIDVGTSGIKLAIFNTRGELIALEHRPHSSQNPMPGWSEIAPAGWWRAIVAGIPAVAEQGGIDPRQVSAVGVSAMMAVLALDGNGEPLRPAILFNDTRSAAQVERLNGLVAPRQIERITGNRVATGSFAATSLRWMAENEPDLYERTARFAHSNTYVVAKLTGETALDWATATTTGLYEIDGAGGWSQTLCRGFGIPREKLPKVIAPGAIAGTISVQAAAETGLTEGIPVAMGAIDLACSALGCGIVQHGQIFESMGTSGNVTICSATPAFDTRFLNRRHVVPGHWLLIGTTSAPGAAVTWFRDQFCAAEADHARRSGRPQFELMEELASQSPPGANHLLFLPYLSGERTPLWDPRARGVFFGLSLATTRADTYRAVLEGTAFGMRQNLELVEEMAGHRVDEVLTVGGGAKSSLWCQLKADITQRRVRALEFQETAAFGAALLGGIAAGLYAGYHEAAANAPRQSRLFEPRPELAPTYDAIYRIYKGLYPTLKDIYRALADVPTPTS